MTLRDETEWFIGVTVKTKPGAVPSGLDPEDPEVAAEFADGLGAGRQITQGYHNPEDPHTTLVFEAGGWWWYAHDLEMA